MDVPTIGVDLWAKSDFVAAVRTMADKGTTGLVASSEWEELTAISDRILVLHAGCNSDQMNRRDVGMEEALYRAIQGRRHPAAAGGSV